MGYNFGGHGGEEAESGKYGNSGKLDPCYGLIQRQVEKGMEVCFSIDGGEC